MLIHGIDNINEAAIPDNAKLKCPFCNIIIYGKGNMYDHIESVHSAMIPKDMSAAQFYYNEKNNKTHGSCVICKKATEWNDVTNKYKRFCENPKCKEIYKDQFKNRMIGKYGKTHLLNDPDQQRKMLEGRAISGEYKWSDGAVKKYVGGYEKNFLEFLDLMLGFESDDIMTPAPQTFYYKIPESHKLEDGKSEYFWIPDLYIASINTIIEIKDGGNNPNTHPNIVKNDKIKEKFKDELMQSQKEFNYIKVTDNDFAGFIKFMLDMKTFEEVPSAKNKIDPLVMIQEATVDLAPKYKIKTYNGNVEIDTNISDLFIVDIDGRFALSFDANLDRLFVYEDSVKDVMVIHTKDIHEEALIYKFNFRMDMSILDNTIKYIAELINNKHWMGAFAQSEFQDMSLAFILQALAGVQGNNLVHSENAIADRLMYSLINTGDFFILDNAKLFDGTLFKIIAMTKDISKFNMGVLLESAYKSRENTNVTVMDTMLIMEECSILGLDGVTTLKTDKVSFKIAVDTGRTIVTDRINYLKI